MREVKCIAHRGASAYEPENTLRAFRRAVELGADMIEFDVRLSLDGHLVVIHDEDVARVTGEPGLVAEMTLAELKGLSITGGERIPTLTETIAAVGGEVELNIEVKAPGLEEKLARLWIEGAEESDKGMLVSCFDYTVLERLKALSPRLPIAFLTVDLEEAQKAILKGEIDALHPLHTIVSEELVVMAHDRDVAVNVWTVDDPARMAALICCDVDGICSNRPDVLRRVIDAG
jgi:glycerophosphoryl diester phosphodiesterase